MLTTPRPALLSMLLAAAALSGAATGQTVPGAQGAAAAWLKLLALQTTASAMHTTAHPDDEHGGVLALLSRGSGARVSMLTLTRGESGDNAIGPELFDALGLIRTEELLMANRYYGIARQYFTTAVDYGFSKRLDETLEKWDRNRVLGEMVHVIRTERPFVLISRFQGNPRDGHGNHQAAGLLTQAAFTAAGDPTMFPEQIAAGLQPWQPLKLYVGGVRENEDWTLRVDAGEYNAVLGESYQTLGRMGLAFQRSQNGGRFSPHTGPAVSYYKRVQSVVDAPAKERSFFDGIDTTIPGLYRALRITPPARHVEVLTALHKEIEAAVAAFTFADPSACVPALARALAAARTASATPGIDGDAAIVIRRKEEQIADAIHSALGIVLTAVAQPPGTPESTGPFNVGPPPMGPIVPGQTFEVRAVFANRSAIPVTNVHMQVASHDPDGEWAIRGSRTAPAAQRNEPVAATFTITSPESAALTRPYFSRSSIQAARYTVVDPRHAHRPFTEDPVEAIVRYHVDGVPIEVRRPVTRLESNIPYGYASQALAVVPAVAVSLDPAHAVLPLGSPGGAVPFTAEVLNNRDAKSEGTLRLQGPPGWKVSPASHSFQFSRAGERALFRFEVSAPSLEPREYRLEAVASSDGREYREGYTTIRHRDLATRYLYRPASGAVRGVDVTVTRGLRVGYVMGVGDEVPSGLKQLGADVRLLGQQELATADLKQFDTIMTGTRAYAVRDDLKTYNRRLLEYVHDGGNLIVLYNTQEFVPNQFAPYPAELPRSAEEVSEEDSPVEVLAPNAPVLSTPNRITAADFEGWVEQRGSKFWTTWDDRYAPIIATWDRGQPPQKGGWLHARYGKGHYTYFAYALHRQLPYGVPGAYRLLANLLSLNKRPG